MKHPFTSLFFLLSISLISTYSKAQEITADSVRKIVKDSPAFSIYKDNYFISGIPLNDNINKYTSDAKFQISFKHRLTDARLPFSTYLFLTYTQKSFWDIYQESFPFAENNYNPGLGLAKIIYNKNRLQGIASLSFEHESNGRDSIYSRGWNRIMGSYTFFPTPKTRLTLSGWIPFSYKTDQPDFLEYVGLGEASIDWNIIKNKLYVDSRIRKGTSWDWKGSIKTSVSFKIKDNGNQFVMIQWYYGYAESLIEYDRLTSMLRLGMVIKPELIMNK